MSDWEHFQQHYLFLPEIEFALDWSRAGYSNADLQHRLGADLEDAQLAMQDLESGAIANQDENRMVGHYWLRAPELAPDAQISECIQNMHKDLKSFAADIHEGKIGPAKGRKFKSVLSIGIGGSALGPQFVDRALQGKSSPVQVFYLDNTDPAGMFQTLEAIPELSETLVITISKSGRTKETRNAQMVTARAFADAGLNFARHAVAVTGEGSELDQRALDEGWLARFPMWDWVGGRTSEFSAVGLLIAALQGIDIEALLLGAAAMDRHTRVTDWKQNPAAVMAALWHAIGNGSGDKNMVVLPYKDRLELVSRYLQQLVMESLGKESDRNGNRVQQGISVFGNKGSTDQHAFVQQLRDGRDDFFVTFIEVLEDLSGDPTEGAALKRATELMVEPEMTSGDYLTGFLLGTQHALHESGRPSILLTVPRVDACSVGALIALFERAVGLYAELVNVNAYHQPGVEAGKLAAGEMLALQAEVLSCLSATSDGLDFEALIEMAKAKGRERSVFKLLNHLVANGRVIREEGKDFFQGHYRRATEGSDA